MLKFTICAICFFTPFNLAVATQDATKSDLILSDAVDRGEQLVLESGEQRNLMPNRWAALTHYEVESTPDDPDYMRIKGIAYTAVDKALGITVQRRKQSDYQRGGAGGQLSNWPSSYYDWKSKDEKLMLSGEKWVATKPGLTRPHLDPFMLWMSSSYILQEGVTSDSFTVGFFGAGRNCVMSVKRKNGNVESIWGEPQAHKKETRLFTVLHESDFGMPVEFECGLCSDWDPKKPFQRGKLVERISTQWKHIKEFRVNVPESVHANWMDNDESLEAKFTIKWLFEGDVPDSAFNDPRKEKIFIPSFVPTKDKSPDDKLPQSKRK